MRMTAEIASTYQAFYAAGRARLAGEDVREAVLAALPALPVVRP